MIWRVQWLPMYQLTEFEFGVIANTMLQVFGEVSMWRNNFTPGQEQVALIARLEPGMIPVPPATDLEEMRAAVLGLNLKETSPGMVQVEPESMPFFYAGNLTEARELFADYPLNTDDRPVIEFQTPWRFREVAATDKVIWCVGPKLLAWMERIFEASPLNKDPLLEDHPPGSRHLVRSGMAFHHAMVNKSLRKQGRAETFWRIFQQEWIRAATPDNP